MKNEKITNKGLQLKLMKKSIQYTVNSLQFLTLMLFLTGKTFIFIYRAF